MKNKQLFSFDECEPSMGAYISMVWEDGSDCECIYFGLNEKIKPLPTHWYPVEDSYDKETLEFFLPDEFKGLSKEYILDCMFDNEIQKNWVPGMGDIIVGPTGNIFVISVVDELHESIGGTRYYYGGGSCNRDGGRVLDSTFYYTANESGIYYHPIKGKIKNYNHSSIREYRYVPYPHELKKIKNG